MFSLLSNWVSWHSGKVFALHERGAVFVLFVELLIQIQEYLIHFAWTESSDSVTIGSEEWPILEKDKVHNLSPQIQRST